jgi:hypothetical protein
MYPSEVLVYSTRREEYISAVSADTLTLLDTPLILKLEGTDKFGTCKLTGKFHSSYSIHQTSISREKRMSYPGLCVVVQRN